MGCLQGHLQQGGEHPEDLGVCLRWPWFISLSMANVKMQGGCQPRRSEFRDAFGRSSCNLGIRLGEQWWWDVGRNDNRRPGELMRRLCGVLRQSVADSRLLTHSRLLVRMRNHIVLSPMNAHISLFPRLPSPPPSFSLFFIDYGGHSRPRKGLSARQ